jgi:dipeptidyl aminopeptidase/acylaminoacyl peptidase
MNPHLLAGSAGVLVAIVTLAASVPAGRPQRPVGDLFLPGIVSTDAIEDGITFGPDGRELIFARRAGNWGEAIQPSALYVTRLTVRGWSAPTVLPFSGTHADGDPSLSPDGKRLFFTSDRPTPNGMRGDSDMWLVERNGAGWATPRHLGAEVNSTAEEYSPAVTADGTLYFASTRDGGLGQGDLYRARPLADGWTRPEPLGPKVNSPTGEWNVFVAPDERFLLFEASGRPTNRSPSGDLYVSYRTAGEWTAALPLDALNTEESELAARLSPDGARLYFVRSMPRAAGDGRDASILWVPAALVLPHLRRAQRGDSGR